MSKKDNMGFGNTKVFSNARSFVNVTPGALPQAASKRQELMPDWNNKALNNLNPNLYTCGFLFSIDRRDVTLIQKNRPELQKGKLNGIGGKIEESESSIACMQREFYEEAGLMHADWEHYASLICTKNIPNEDFEVTAVIDFYRAFSNYFPRTMTDEAVVKVSVDTALRSKSLVPNLRILIPLALDTSGIVKPVTFYDDGRSN